VAIVLVGLFLLAENLNIGFARSIDFGHILGLLWPLLFIGWGYEALQKRNYLTGGILASIGAHFLLDNLSFISPVFDSAKNIIWPGFLVLIGFYILVSPDKKHRKSSRDEFSYQGKPSSKSSFKDFEDDYEIVTPKKAPANRSKTHSHRVKVVKGNGKDITINVSKTVDSAVKEIKSAVREIKAEFKDNPSPSRPQPAVNLTKEKPQPTQPEASPVPPVPPTPKVNLNKGAQENEPKNDYSNQRRVAKQHRSYSASFNSKKIKFTEDDFVEGENLIDLTCMFGDVKIGIPRNMDIILEGQVTLGDINFLGEKHDGISQAIKDQYLSPTPSNKQVRIKATVVLGDLKIKLV
jgi:hypothetical protein